MRGVSSDAPWRGQGDVIRNRVTGNGKGDRPRPTTTDDRTLAERYCKMFGCRRRSDRSIECMCCGRVMGPRDY